MHIFFVLFFFGEDDVSTSRTNIRKKAILSKNCSASFLTFLMVGPTSFCPISCCVFSFSKMISSGDLDFCLLFVSFAGGTWVELDPVFHKAGWLLAA